MLRRKSPKDVLESVPHSKVEHAYVKFPGRDLIDVTLKSADRSVSVSFSQVGAELEKVKRKEYSFVHTHPHEGTRPHERQDYLGLARAYPSRADIAVFLADQRMKSMIIASQNKTGKIDGYFVWRKTHKTPTSIYDPHKETAPLWSLFKIFFQRIKLLKFSDYSSSAAEGREKDVQRVGKQYHLNYRFVPAHKGVVEADYLNRKRKAYLEDLVGTAILLLLVGYALTPTLTGYAAYGITSSTVAPFAFWGLVGLLFSWLCLYRIKGLITAHR